MSATLSRRTWFALGLLVGTAVTLGHAAVVQQVVWRFDNLQSIGGFRTQIDGQPRVVAAPGGRAVAFDGQRDSLLIEGRPLVAARQFTIEVLFRPDGGAFEQRFMHIAETDRASGLDTLTPPAGGSDSSARFMFEIRVKDGRWYLDAYVNSTAGSQALVFPEKSHPLGPWYAVAQTYDGQTYRTYVDRVLQGEADVAFAPHGPGRVRVGARMNKVNYFNGLIAEARFTDRALRPAELLMPR